MSTRALLVIFENYVCIHLKAGSILEEIINYARIHSITRHKTAELRQMNHTAIYRLETDKGKL